MKILKVYDKTNRNVYIKNDITGNISIKEYETDSSYTHILINTKIFNTKEQNKIAYISILEFENNKLINQIDISGKYIVHEKLNEIGKLLLSSRTNTRDSKSFIITERFYNEDEDFIELENHKGNKTLKFKIKNHIIKQLTDGNK